MARRGNVPADEAVDQKGKSLQELAVNTEHIANCLAFLTIRFSDYRKKPDSERIPFLHSLGFDTHAIAAILGTTPETVRVRLSKLKSAKKRKESGSAQD